MLRIGCLKIVAFTIAVGAATAGFAQGYTISIPDDERQTPLPPKDAAIRTAYLQFATRSGSNEDYYPSAQIEMKYKALACAGDVQIAYHLDRQSVTVGGSRPEGVVAPTTVAIDVDVFAGNRNGARVGQFKDAIAGEALGMGCFSGQTKTIGRLRDLLPSGYDVSNPQSVRQWLDLLVIIQRGPLSEALLRPSRPAVDTQAEVEAARRANAAEATSAAQAAQAFRAQLEAGRQAQRDRQAALAAVAAREAERVRLIADQAAAYEARMADWRRRVAACQGGDRSACAQ